VRGKLGPILSGIGGFLLALAVLLNVYAYPKLAVAPLDQESQSSLVGPDAVVFDIASLEEIETDVSVTAFTVGDVKAAQDHREKTGENVAVWKNATSTRSADNVLRSASIDRVAFDRFTGEAVDCCDSFTEVTAGNAEEITFEGQIFKFPFQTQKKTYQWWDGTIREARPAEFVREENFKGIDTYVFKQVIEPTVWTQMEVPPSVVGEVGKESLMANRTYANTRTFWVEPETGVVLNRVEEQRATLQFEDEDRVTLTNADVRFSDETVKKNIDDYSSTPGLLKAVRVTLPIVLGVLGVLLVVVGLVIVRRRNRASAK
jgi:hypothetical protein